MRGSTIVLRARTVSSSGPSSTTIASNCRKVWANTLSSARMSGFGRCRVGITTDTCGMSGICCKAPHHKLLPLVDAGHPCRMLLGAADVTGRVKQAFHPPSDRCHWDFRPASQPLPEAFAVPDATPAGALPYANLRRTFRVRSNIDLSQSESAGTGTRYASNTSGHRHGTSWQANFRYGLAGSRHSSRGNNATGRQALADISRCTNNPVKDITRALIKSVSRSNAR